MLRAAPICALLLVACGHPATPTPAHPTAPAAARTAPADPRPIAPCPAHRWTTPPAFSGPLFNDACRGMAPGACQAQCDQGVGMACVKLAVDLGIRHQDNPRQLELFARACDLGSLLGCTNLAATVSNEEPEWRPNPACGTPLFRAVCDAAGEPNACAMLGHAYVEGFGVPRDPARALAAFERGCDRAHADETTPYGSRDGVAMACEGLLDASDHGQLGAVPRLVLVNARELVCEIAGVRC